jgi:hypothetical protein
MGGWGGGVEGLCHGSGVFACPNSQKDNGDPKDSRRPPESGKCAILEKNVIVTINWINQILKVTIFCFHNMNEKLMIFILIV